MAVTSGAMMAIFTVPASLGQRLEGDIARRVAPQHLERNPPPAAPPDLAGRVRVEEPGQLNCLVVTGKLDGQRPRDAGVTVSAGGEPVEVVRTDVGGGRGWGDGTRVEELWFEPVQQFPGQDDVGARITVPVRDEPARLLAGENTKVRGRVAALQLPARRGRSLSPGHRPQPSSYRSPIPALTAAAPREAAAGAAPRRSGPACPPWGCGP